MFRLQFLCVLACLCGCSSDPRAPALADSPLYQNEREGIRLMVPDDWRMHARAELPSGTQDRLQLLAQYHRQPPARPGTFEVCRFDAWDNERLDDLGKQSSHGAKEWLPSGSKEAIEIAKVAAVRRAFTANVGKEKMTKDVVAVKRNGRGYWFVAIYRDGDATGRDQFKRIIDGIIWTN